MKAARRTPGRQATEAAAPRGHAAPALRAPSAPPARAPMPAGRGRAPLTEPARLSRGAGRKGGGAAGVLAYGCSSRPIQPRSDLRRRALCRPGRMVVRQVPSPGRARRQKGWRVAAGARCTRIRVSVCGLISTQTSMGCSGYATPPSDADEGAGHLRRIPVHDRSAAGMLCGAVGHWVSLRHRSSLHRRGSCLHRRRNSPRAAQWKPGHPRANAESTL